MKEMLSYPIVLRAEGPIYRLFLPPDLTASEARRLCAYVTSLVIETPPPKAGEAGEQE